LNKNTIPDLSNLMNESDKNQRSINIPYNISSDYNCSDVQENTELYYPNNKVNQNKIKVNSNNLKMINTLINNGFNQNGQRNVLIDFDLQTLNSEFCGRNGIVFEDDQILKNNELDLVSEISNNKNLSKFIHFDSNQIPNNMVNNNEELPCVQKEDNLDQTIKYQNNIINKNKTSTKKAFPGNLIEKKKKLSNNLDKTRENININVNNLKSEKNPKKFLFPSQILEDIENSKNIATQKTSPKSKDKIGKIEFPQNKSQTPQEKNNKCINFWIKISS